MLLAILTGCLEPNVRLVCIPECDKTDGATNPQADLCPGVGTRTDAASRAEMRDGCTRLRQAQQKRSADRQKPAGTPPHGKITLHGNSDQHVECNLSLCMRALPALISPL